MYAVHVREAFTQVEALKDFSMLFAANMQVDEGEFIVQLQQSAELGRIQYRPTISRVPFTNDVRFTPSVSLPRLQESDATVPLRWHTHYKHEYSGALTGTIDLEVDFSKISTYFESRLIVLYGFYTMDPDKSLTIAPDAEVTIDLNGIMRWSKLAFGRYIGRQDSLSLTYIFKYVGQALPELGVLKLGFKVFGQTTPGVNQVQGRVGAHFNLSSIATDTRLMGTPDI